MQRDERDEGAWVLGEEEFLHPAQPKAIEDQNKLRADSYYKQVENEMADLVREVEFISNTIEAELKETLETASLFLEKTELQAIPPIFSATLETTWREVSQKVRILNEFRTHEFVYINSRESLPFNNDEAIILTQNKRFFEKIRFIIKNGSEAQKKQLEVLMMTSYFNTSLVSGLAISYVQELSELIDRVKRFGAKMPPPMIWDEKFDADLTDPSITSVLDSGAFIVESVIEAKKPAPQLFKSMEPSIKIQSEQDRFDKIKNEIAILEEKKNQPWWKKLGRQKFNSEDQVRLDNLYLEEEELKTELYENNMPTQVSENIKTPEEKKHYLNDLEANLKEVEDRLVNKEDFKERAASQEDFWEANLEVLTKDPDFNERTDLLIWLDVFLAQETQNTDDAIQIKRVQKEVLEKKIQAKEKEIQKISKRWFVLNKEKILNESTEQLLDLNEEYEETKLRLKKLSETKDKLSKKRVKYKRKYNVACGVETRKKVTKTDSIKKASPLKRMFFSAFKKKTIWLAPVLAVAVATGFIGKSKEKTDKFTDDTTVELSSSLDFKANQHLKLPPKKAQKFEVKSDAVWKSVNEHFESLNLKEKDKVKAVATTTNQIALDALNSGTLEIGEAELASASEFKKALWHVEHWGGYEQELKFAKYADNIDEWLQDIEEEMGQDKRDVLEANIASIFEPVQSSNAPHILEKNLDLYKNL